MLVYDDEFAWEGFGGKLKLGRGKCLLKIFDLSKDPQNGLALLKPMVVVGMDHPGSKMSVRGCSSHIATMVCKKFNIDPKRMQFVEYHPEKTYGEESKNVIPEVFEAVDFTWQEDMAIHPTLRPLQPPLLDLLKGLMSGRGS